LVSLHALLYNNSAAVAPSGHVGIFAEVRPGSTALNAALPGKNSGPAFLEAGSRIVRAVVEAGLPER
jgi:hypothetical protein